MGIKGFIFKIFLCISISIFVIGSILYYSFNYIKNNNLYFTESDKFILLLFSCSTLIICFIFIILLIYLINLKILIIDLLNSVCMSEDNIIEFNKTTQEMIIDLSNIMGVNSHSKKE